MKKDIKIIIYIGLILYIPFFINIVNIENKNLPFIGSDPVEYKNLSESIISSGSFSINGDNLEVFRTPGYPTYLAITKFLFGNYWVSIFFQILLTISTSLLIYLIFSKYVSNYFRFVPSILLLIEPSIFIYSLIGYSDILFLFLFTLFIYLLINKTNNNTVLCFAGIILALATYTRTISIFFIVPSIIFIIFSSDRDNTKLLIKNILVLLFSFILVLFPWMMRNYNLFNHFTFSSLSGYNMVHYNIPEFIAYKENISAEQARAKYYKENFNKIKNPEELRRGENIDMVSKSASVFIKENFIDYSLFHFNKSIPLLLSSSLKNLFSLEKEILLLDNKIEYHNISNIIMRGEYSKLYKIIISEWYYFAERAFWAILIILSVISVYFVRKENFRNIFILFVSIIIYFTFLTGPVSYSRYRIPIIPFIFITSSYSAFIIYKILISKNLTTSYSSKPHQ